LRNFLFLVKAFKCATGLLSLFFHLITRWKLLIIKYANKFQVRIKLFERLHLWGFGHLVECSIP